LAIHLGEPQDSRLIARKLEDATLGVFASPQYLKRHGTPKSLADRKQDDLIQVILPGNGRPMPWIFKDEVGADIDFTFRSRQRVHEDVLGGVSWARAGGLFQIYHLIAADAVQRDQLVEIVKPFAGRSRPFHILHPQNRHLSARVRAFVDFLLREITGVGRPRCRQAATTASGSSHGRS
jgi:DNA-binding transcriptional LysR family regulator